MLVDPGETLLFAGLDLRELDLKIVNRFDDRLYFATPSGLIVCIRESGQINPRLSKIRRPIRLVTFHPEGIKPPCRPLSPRNQTGSGRRAGCRGTGPGWDRERETRRARRRKESRRPEGRAQMNEIVPIRRAG